MAPVESPSRLLPKLKRHSRHSGTRGLLLGFLFSAGTLAALGGCTTHSGQIASRLASTDALAPPPAPQTLPAAAIQQQRYDALDKRALDASENAQAAENAARLRPAPRSPITHIYNGYNGYSRW